MIKPTVKKTPSKFGPVALGREVRDLVTGFSGIAICESRWLNGCVRYTVQPTKLDKEGKAHETACFDTEQLETIGEGVAIPMRETGGPHPKPQRQPDPVRR
jgi:hypothetical protein